MLEIKISCLFHYLRSKFKPSISVCKNLFNYDTNYLLFSSTKDKGVGTI